MGFIPQLLYNKKMNKKEYSSLIKIMSEEEIKKDLLEKLKIVTGEFFGIIKEIQNNGEIPSRELSSALSKETDKVEAFLDDYGAANNKRFFYFRELVASIRWINIAVFQSIHILLRFKNYNIELDERQKNKFLKEIKKNLSFYLHNLKNLITEVFKEGENLGLEIKPAVFSGNGSLLLQKKILPPDLDENVIHKKEERVIEILMKYLETCEKFKFFVCEMGKEENPTEESLEKFRSIFNQLQSIYDTYLKNTDVENEISNLKKIRGHISISLHLLEIGRALIHFYERHSNKIKKHPATTKIANLIDKDKIKDNVKNFILKETLIFNTKGEEVSKKIFAEIKVNPDEFILETKILIIPSYRIEDFHIRPIMPITQIANKYKIDSFLYFNRNKYNLKSPIEMAIAIPDIRESLAKENTQIMIQGPKKSVKEMVKFFQKKCGAYQKENTCMPHKFLDVSS